LGVELTEGTGDSFQSVRINISQSLIRQKKLQPGQVIQVTGLLSAKPWKNHPARVEFNINVDDANVVQQPEATNLAVRSEDQTATLESLRILRARRNPFPSGQAIRISVIHPFSQTTYGDFVGHLQRLGSALDVSARPTDMTNSAAIAKAISEASGNVLVVLRGGGDSNDFAPFDTLPVLTALAKHRAYRILGVGHSNTATLADLVCDCRANTPSDAGGHICELIEKHRADAQRIAGLETEIESLRSDLMNSRTELAMQRQQLQRQPAPRLLIVLVAAAILGVVIAVVLSLIRP
jgi:exodeoxyribonuclease VII large subunit